MFDLKNINFCVHICKNSGKMVLPDANRNNVIKKRTWAERAVVDQNSIKRGVDFWHPFSQPKWS